MQRVVMRPLPFFAACLSLALSLLAEEGMWPLNMLPKEHIKKTYHLSLSDDWCHVVQTSCLRLSHGGSASLLSSNGLVMTNHHVGAKSIYHASTSQNDLLEMGFYAKTYSEEIKCPNLHADQLIEIRDVTEQIKQPLTSIKDPIERSKERKALIARLTENARKETNLHPEMVTLYRGQRYHLYLYKRYTDLRLVMCPEQKIAAFGGNTENFEFPRHCLDLCFFRLYEGGKPATTPNHFTLSTRGPLYNQPLFVLGHPGQTNRILTSRHLKFVENTHIPLILNFVSNTITCLETFSAQGPERARVAADLLHQYYNGYKAYTFTQKALKTEALVDKKKESERLFFKTLSAEQAQPWLTLSTLVEKVEPLYSDYLLLERWGSSHFSKLFSWARLLLRSAEERAKPNEKRLREYQESALPALEARLFSKEPFYTDLDIALLDEALRTLRYCLDQNHPILTFLEKKTARDMVARSRLNDINYRKHLYHNPQELRNNGDPLLAFARVCDGPARTLREQYENGFVGPQKECYDHIADLSFQHQTEPTYPDATFTLRLSIGTLKGYFEEKKWISPITTVAEAFQKGARRASEPDFALPLNWNQRKADLKGSTFFNFASTHDIIGGNSGSPVINVNKEVVGLIFDGNRHSHLWNYQFDETQGRAISVHSTIILEALRTVYQAERLVNELVEAPKKSAPTKKNNCAPNRSPSPL